MGSTFNSGTTARVVDLNGHTENDGAIQDGAAISIVNRPAYKGLDKVAITGGTFTAQSNNGAALKAYSWNSSTKKDDATYSVTNADGTVVYFTDAQSANDYAKESGAQAPKRF